MRTSSWPLNDCSSVLFYTNLSIERNHGKLKPAAGQQLTVIFIVILSPDCFLCCTVGKSQERDMKCLVLSSQPSTAEEAQVTVINKSKSSELRWGNGCCVQFGLKMWHKQERVYRTRASHNDNISLFVITQTVQRCVFLRGSEEISRIMHREDSLWIIYDPLGAVQHVRYYNPAELVNVSLSGAR